MSLCRGVLCTSVVVLSTGAFPQVGPTLAAKSALVMDERSGKVFFEKGADSKRFPASTTKILTSLLLLEMCRPDELIIAPSDVESVTGSGLHLRPGEAVTAKDMLYGLMVRSANDGAYATAVHVAGSVPEFARLMNETAKRIGCGNSQFANPHGLHDPNHYSSARDLALIAREAMRNPEFRRAASTRKVQISRSINQEDCWLISKNKTLETDPFADGIKTGYTKPAGYCFVGSSIRGGYRFITVLMACEDWKADQKALIDWAFKNYERFVPANKGEVVGAITLPGEVPTEVPARLEEPVYYARKKGTSPQLSVEFIPDEGLTVPIREGQPIGMAVFGDGTAWNYRAKVVANSDVLQLNTAQASAPWSYFLIAGLLGVSAYAVRRKARRAALAE